jgi:hypothetical protein
MPDPIETAQQTTEILIEDVLAKTETGTTEQLHALKSALLTGVDHLTHLIDGESTVDYYEGEDD